MSFELDPEMLELWKSVFSPDLRFVFPRLPFRTRVNDGPAVETMKWVHVAAHVRTESRISCTVAPRASVLSRDSLWREPGED